MRLIDADALLKRVQKEEIQSQIHDRWFCTCFMSPGGTPSTEWWFVEDLIENTPTIEPERETGEWIADGHHIKCNKCSVYMCIVDREGDEISRNYCPNCGVRMEGK